MVCRTLCLARTEEPHLSFLHPFVHFLLSFILNRPASWRNTEPVRVVVGGGAPGIPMVLQCFKVEGLGKPPRDRPREPRFSQVPDGARDQEKGKQTGVSGEGTRGEEEREETAGERGAGT